MGEGTAGLSVRQGEVLTAAGYRRLLRDVGALLAEGRQTAELAVASVLAATYWRVGRRVLEEELTERAGYGSATLRRLAEELALDHRTLERAVQFARTYEALPAEGLTWGHYRELIRLRDDRARQWYEAQARAQGWSTRALAEAVRGEAFARRRGTRASASASGRAALERPKAASFVYGGEVERVIDGDTIVMRIDLGFDVWRTQPVRLAGIDAAPVNTEEGRRARDYVQQQLARAWRVVVKTQQHDIHMRYVGHVFYALRAMDRGETFARGRYLNAELLSRGLVEAY